jgi:hypothetical protein
LLYWIEQGPVQQSVSNSSKRLRGKVPDKFLNEPEVRFGLELYYDAFWELDRDRSHGSGYTHIPWSSIIRYIEVYDLDEDQAERLQAHLKAMDNAYIKALADKQDAKNGSK